MWENFNISMLTGFLQGSPCPCLPVFSCAWLELRCLGRMAHKKVHPTFLFLSLKISWDDNLEQEERHLPIHPGVHQTSARKTVSILHYQSELSSGSFQPLLPSAPHLDSALLCLLGYCLNDTFARGLVIILCKSLLIHKVKPPFSSFQNEE